MGLGMEGIHAHDFAQMAHRRLRLVLAGEPDAEIVVRVDEGRAILQRLAVAAGCFLAPALVAQHIAEIVEHLGVIRRERQRPTVQHLGLGELGFARPGISLPLQHRSFLGPAR